MSKFKVGDKVRVTYAISHDDNPYVGNVYTVKRPFHLENWYELENIGIGMSEIQLELVSSESYMLEYMEKNGDFSREDFDSKEEALESIEENSHEIDFDEPVKLLVISKVYNVQKTKRFELVEE